MAFNVNHLLNTNSTPSPDQRDDLQNFILQLDGAISNTDEDISSINEQIQAMQAKILVLQTRRTRLVRQRRCYSSLLSPVRYLPIEIFGKIFVYATRDRPKHVLNLSAVCQLWRHAALSTPMLWSTLELGHHTTKLNMDHHIDSWIQRAHSYPLSLVIRKQGGFLDPVDSVLITYIADHQWKSITLESNDRSILTILERLEFSNVEMLESFKFSRTSRVSSKFKFPDALRYAPKLKTLSLNIHDRVVFDTLPFPWSQLTSLTIMFWDNYYDSIAVEILQACVNLEEFIVAGECDGSSPWYTLNYLRKLHIHGNNKVFLLPLKSPSIQDFSIRTSGLKYFHRDDHEVYYNYIEKNSSTLLKLSIAPSHNRFLKSIPYLRTLVELKLYDNYYEDGSIMVYNILSFLVVDPAERDPSTIPLPRLEALEVTCQATEKNQRMFVKVIDSRWWSDEEENARQIQGQRSLSRIKRSVLMNVHTEYNMFCRDDVDFLRGQGMSIEYLTFFNGMDEDDFYNSSYYSYWFDFLDY